jgi:hypothetical protein
MFEINRPKELFYANILITSFNQKSSNNIMYSCVKKESEMLKLYQEWEEGE